MRKGMKAFAAVLAVATASTMSLTAFADTTASTDYEVSAGNSSNVTVTTTVSGVTTNDEVAYVVYTGDSITSDSIVFIDQQKATDSTVTFTFTDSKSKILSETGSTVKVGTSSTANTEALTNALQLKKGTVTYNVGNNGKVLAHDSIDFATGANHAIGDLSSVSFRVFPDAGYKLASIKKNSAETVNTATDGVYTFDIEENTTFDFTFEAISNSVAAKITVPDNTSQVNTLTKATDSTSAVTYAKVDDGKYDEIGFAFSDDSSKITTSTTAKVEGVGYYSALGVGSDGSFAIQLTEKAAEGATWATADKVLKDTMYAWSYVKSGDTYTYGSMITLSSAGE